MGIEAQLRRESGETVAEVGDPNMVLSRATSKAFSETRLLKYLTPEKLSRDTHLYLWFVGD
jgi:hypothetical protein